MKKRSIGFVYFVVFVVAPQAQTFRSGVYTVQVSVTVTDANGRLITGLAGTDFEVFEDGDLQPITQFSDQRVPVSLGVMLDASDSMRGQPMVDARGAVDRFVADLLEPVDQAFVSIFNHLTRIVVPWTRPPAQLKARLAGERPSGGTAIYDALVATAPVFERREHARAALIVISDGADTASGHSLVQARDIVRRSDAFIYAIAIDSDDRRDSTRVNADALRDLTGPSGGYTEVVRTAADVGPATERIARELNSQYTIGYTTPKAPDGSYRLIRVHMKTPGQFARSRRGYYGFPRWPSFTPVTKALHRRRLDVAAAPYNLLEGFDDESCRYRVRGGWTLRASSVSAMGASGWSTSTARRSSTWTVPVVSSIALCRSSPCLVRPGDDA